MNRDMELSSKEQQKNRKQSKKWLKNCLKELKGDKKIEEESLDDEALTKKKNRFEDFKNTVEKNYANTFIKSVEKAANKKFKSNKIKKIKLDYMLNNLTNVNIYDYDDNLIHDKKLEDKIFKFAELKKEANDRNSDRRFKERKQTNMHDSLLNRSLPIFSLWQISMTMLYKQLVENHIYFYLIRLKLSFLMFIKKKSMVEFICHILNREHYIKLILFHLYWILLIIQKKKKI